MVSPLLGWLLGPTFSEAARRDELRLHPTGRSWLRWNQFRWDPWGTPRKILQIGIIEDFQGGNSMYDDVCLHLLLDMIPTWNFTGLLGAWFQRLPDHSDWGLNPPWGPSSSTCYSSVDPMIWVCLKMDNVPHCTQWFCWSLSLLNGYNWDSCSHSLDWFKGKFTGNHGFYHQIWRAFRLKFSHHPILWSMISNDWEYGPSERSKPIKCHSQRFVNPGELVGWNQDSPTNWSSFCFWRLQDRWPATNPGDLLTPQRMPVFLISYAM